MSLDTIGSQIENPTNDRDHTTTAFTNKRRMNVIVVIIINGPKHKRLLTEEELE